MNNITSDYRLIPFELKGVIFDTKGDRLSALISKVTSVLEKIWGYVKHLVKTTKQVLAAVKKGMPKSANPSFLFRLNKAIAALGLLSLLNILITFDSAPANAKKLAQAVRLSDGEGIIKEAISRLLEAGGILSDVSTFVTSLVTLDAIPTVAFFGLIALPLTLTLLSASIVLGVYNTVFQSIHLHQMPKSCEELRGYLEKKLDVSDAELKEYQMKKYGAHSVTMLEDDRKHLELKKQSILTRQTDKKVVEYMKKLRVDLETNSLVAKNGLSDLKTLLRRKIVLELVGTVAKVAMLAVIVAGLVFPYMAPVVIPVVGGAIGLFSLGTHVYQNHFMDRGLKNDHYFHPIKPRSNINWESETPYATFKYS